MLTRGNKRKLRLGHTAQYSPSITHRKDRLRRLLVIMAFVVLVGATTEFPILNPDGGQYEIENEVVASRTLRAAFAFDSEDLDATREKRQNAAAQVPRTYSVDLERVKNQLLTLKQRINTLKERGPQVDAAIRETLLGSEFGQPRQEIIAAAIANLAAEWKEDPLFEGFPPAEALATWMTPSLASVPRPEFGTQQTEGDESGGEAEVVRVVTGLIEPESEGIALVNFNTLTELAEKGLEYVLMKGVIQSGSFTPAEGEATPKVIILRGISVVDLKLSEEDDLAAIPEPDSARTNLRAFIADKARELETNETGKDVNWEGVQYAAFEMATLGVIDSLFYDQVVTEGNRELARANVEPEMKHIDTNLILQYEGQRWTQQSHHDVTTYWKIVHGGSPPVRSVFSPLFSNVIFVALLLAMLMRAMPLFATRRVDTYKATNVLLLIICSVLILGRITSFFEITGFVVPVAAGAILLAILTNARLAAMASLLLVFLLSIQYGHNWELMAVAGAMCFGGISSLYAVRRRGDMAGAAIKATAFGMITVIAIALTTDSLIGWMTLNRLAIILLNGIVCMFMVPALLSPLERLFGITTDIQLLEYSDLNNEILSRLAIEVPATYAHSLMMGQLAEAAADGIGANGLLARVCAYYHDIGKLRRPEYFSENQAGQNIHDDLSPRLSSRAIASHVVEGVEIAKEFHLPDPIISGIAEHHGSLLIGFFYQQALEQQKHGDAVEEDFRYPGPKPQSSETAILMICDAVESGIRSIKNPNEERINEFVQKIIQARSEDRQFDECDLRLKDLDTIGHILTQSIMTTFHTRIAYPERAPEEKADNVIPMTRGWE